MIKRTNNRSREKGLSRISPQLLVLIIIGLVAGGSVTALLLSKSDKASDANLTPRAARVERVEGDVGVVHAFDGSEQEWTQATVNTPLSVGDRIEARENSHASIAFTGRRFARLDPGARLDVLSLADQRTQLALRDGSALFDLSDLSSGELFEIATPHGAVDFMEPGLYQVGYGDDGNTWISVLSGLAQVVGLGGTGEIGAGEIVTLAAQVAAPLLLSKLAPDLAGGIVDDYYGSRYPDVYDGRYRYYDSYLDDPFYYDPYRRSTSYRYVNNDIPGIHDLDYYGDWVEVGDYGRCWSPRVDTGWSPYRHGYWHNDNTWGPTWVSQEPWGWAPYHYGRWSNVSGGRWVWVPDSISVEPRYAPALVAFVPVRDSHIGWVPLAPGETYVPRYYDSSYNTHYLASPDVVRQVISVERNFVNLAVPEAVTVVPIDRFTGLIRPNSVERVDHQWIARSQPVLDPYAVTHLRQLAMSDKTWKRHLKRERRLARQGELAPVVTSVAPSITAFERRSIDGLRVTTVPDRERKRKIKMERRAEQAVFNNGRGPRPPIPNPNASSVAQDKGQRRAALAIGEARDRQAINQIDRERRKEEKRIRKQQKAIQPSGAVFSQPTPVNPRSVNPRKEEKRQRRAAANAQRVQPAPVFNAPARTQRTEVERQQRKAQKQAARQQQPVVERRSQPVFAPQVAQPQMNNRKAERQAIRQQRKQERAQVRAVPNHQAPVAVPQRQPQVQQVQKARPQQQRPQHQPKQQAAGRVTFNGPPVRQQAPQAQQAREQRKAEKAERKAARGKN